MANLLTSLLAGAVLASSAASAANMTQEDFKATFYLTDEPSKSLPTANGETAYTIDQSVVYTNDAGHGFLHNMTGRCVGVGAGSAGSFHSGGYCTYVDADGNMIFSVFHVGSSGAQLEGTEGYTGGTGKYANLTGGGRYTLTRLRPLDKETRPIWEGHVQGHYRLQTAAPQPGTTQ